MDDDPRSTKSTCRPVRTEPSNALHVKSEVPLRFDRPKRMKNTLALCPKCALQSPNLWECTRCRTEFGRFVELLPDTHSQATFVPNFIKIELPPVPDGGDEDRQMRVKPTAAARQEGEDRSPKESQIQGLDSSIASDEGLLSAEKDAEVASPPLVGGHAALVENETLKRLSSPNISTTSENIPPPGFCSSLVANRRSSTNSSNSSSTSSLVRSDTTNEKNNQNRITVENRVRIFRSVQPSSKHLDRSVMNSTSVPGYNGDKCRLEALVDSDDTVVEETRVNGQARVVRINCVSSNGLEPILLEKEYPFDVDKVIFGGPCSLEVVEQVLLFFKSATAIRFGQHALNNVSGNEKVGKLDRRRLWNKNVKSFELTFDRKQYKQQDHEPMVSKILAVLKMANECFPNIKVCNITIPHTNEMDRALDRFVSRFKGQKIIEYGENIIQYTVHGSRSKSNEGRPTSSKKDCDQSESDSLCKKTSGAPSSNMSSGKPNSPNISSVNSTVISSSGDNSDSVIFETQMKTEPSCSRSKTANRIETIELSSDEEVVGDTLNSTSDQPQKSWDAGRQPNSKNKRGNEELQGPLIWEENAPKVPGYAAACRRCGCMSENTAQCDRCNAFLSAKIAIKSVKKRKTEDDVVNETPNIRGTEPTESNQRMNKIEAGLNSIVANMQGSQSTIIDCISIRVGDYEAELYSPHPHKNVLLVSANGITFTVPHRSEKTPVKCEIPHRMIIDVAAHFGIMLPLFVIKTTEVYADFVRQSLGLSETSKAGNYFSFAKGEACQKMIIIHPAPIAPLSVTRVKELMGDKLNLISFTQADTFNRQVQCKCRCSSKK